MKTIYTPGYDRDGWLVSRIDISGWLSTTVNKAFRSIDKIPLSEMFSQSNSSWIEVPTQHISSDSYVGNVYVLVSKKGEGGSKILHVDLRQSIDADSGKGISLIDGNDLREINKVYANNLLLNAMLSSGIRGLVHIREAHWPYIAGRITESGEGEIKKFQDELENSSSPTYRQHLGDSINYKTALVNASQNFLTNKNQASLDTLIEVIDSAPPELLSKIHLNIKEADK